MTATAVPPSPIAPPGVTAALRHTLRLWQPAPGSHAAAQRRLRRDFLEHLRRHPGACFRDGHPVHLTTGLLVLDPPGRHTLLVLHPRRRRWFQPGGHLEVTDADLLAAAAREGREETGYSQLRIDPMPVHLERYRLGSPAGRCQEHLDVRFLAVAPLPTDPAAGADEPLAHGADEPLAHGTDRAAVSGGRVAGGDVLESRWWPLHALPAGHDLGPLLAAGLARLRSTQSSSRIGYRQRSVTRRLRTASRPRGTTPATSGTPGTSGANVARGEVWWT